MWLTCLFDGLARVWAIFEYSTVICYAIVIKGDINHTTLEHNIVLNPALPPLTTYQHSIRVTVYVVGE